MPDYLRRQRERRDFSKFKTLIATPGNAANPLAIPAGGRIGVKSSVLVQPGKLSITVHGRTFGGSGFPANSMQHLGYFERAASFVTALSVPGVISYYVFDPLMVPHKFAEGSF